jgi:hypothetical protein
MAKIELYFGSPLLDKGIDQNENWALNHEISIEKANIDSFKAVMSVLFRPNEEGETYFSLSFCSLIGKSAATPKIKCGTYMANGKRFPKLIIEGDYLFDSDLNREVFITDEHIKSIGEYIEIDFDYEFVSYKRIGKVFLNKNDITYLLRGKAHIFHNGQFLEVKQKLALKTHLK